MENITVEAKEQLLDPVSGKKIFSTLINNKKMWIYKRKETHKDGERNGVPNDWWLKFDKNDGTYDWVPWVDKLTKRPCFEIKIKEGNHIKHKWDEWDIRGSVFCEIFLNGDKVYDFITRDVEYAFAKATVLKTEIMEHPFDFLNPEGEIGRKVFYREEPATIERVILDQGCVIIKKEGSEYFKTPIWHDEDDKVGDEDDRESEVKEEILSPHIWWFRDK